MYHSSVCRAITPDLSSYAPNSAYSMYTDQPVIVNQSVLLTIAGFYLSGCVVCGMQLVHRLLNS